MAVAGYGIYANQEERNCQIWPLVMLRLWLMMTNRVLALIAGGIAICVSAVMLIVHI